MERLIIERISLKQNLNQLTQENKKLLEKIENLERIITNLKQENSKLIIKNEQLKEDNELRKELAKIKDKDKELISE